jgi:alkaline phosphatase D
MSDFSRRDVLKGAGLTAAAGLLAACATPSAGPPASIFPLGASVPVSPALDPGKAVTRLGLGSCFNQGRTGEILEAARRAAPDAFVFMGDNVYGSDTETPDLAILRGAYAAALARPDYRAFRQAMPMFAVWDDHDFGKNDAGARYAYKEATRPLFFDFWGVPADSPRRRHGGIHDSVMTGPPGARLHMILLDTRTFRDDWIATDERDAPGKERYLANPDPAKTILGPAQWAWLAGELAKPADLKILVTSYQLVADGHGWERWGLFPAERARMYDLIGTSGAKNLIVVSGDRHLSAVYREEKGLPYPLTELSASSMNMASQSWSERAEEAGPNRLTPTFRANNFGLLAIDWDKRTVTMEVHDKDNKPVLTHTVDLRTLA